jgi:deazaflavin-dependent oxidoreductase (nitroreductase family)
VTDVNDWNAKVIDEYRQTGGQLSGAFEGAPLLLLHTTGAKTGATRVNPVMYLDLDGRRFVFASKAGADTDPDWFRNLRAHPQVQVEVGSSTYDAVAEPLEGAERDRVYAEQASQYPQFAEYQRQTDRVIPVVEVVPAG